MKSKSIERYVPDEPFPPYSYVTGRFPHPTRDQTGHSFGTESPPCPRPDPERWRSCRQYLYGIDLFNHGYYWESHEVWEGLWHATGRVGPIADFIKGLIKLAAAGVKARENRPEGVRRHAQRAAELFQQTAGQLASGSTCYFGLSLPQLVGFADELARRPEMIKSPTGAAVEVVFPFVLRPE